MATPWQVIFREVAKHVNAFESGDATAVATDYLTTPLTTTEVVDPYYNLALIQDKCIDAHGRLALEIANVRQHPWRTYINNSVTDPLVNGDPLPTVAANGFTIVGAWGQVLSGGVPMSEAAPERVRAYLLHTTTIYTSPYLYYVDGGYIYMTSATANINCCTYERAAIVTTVTSNGDIALPDVLVDAIVAGAVADLVIESKGLEQAGYFKNYFDAAIQSIRNGQTTMPMMTLKATA